jgi:hypothetical protein
MLFMGDPIREQIVGRLKNDSAVTLPWLAISEKVS